MDAQLGSSTGSSKRVKSGEVSDSDSDSDSDPDSEGHTQTREGQLIQCAGYAMEMLSNGGLRTHVLGSLVTDDTIEFLYYDRSIHVRSEPVNFQFEPTLFIAALDAMAALSDSEWGYDSIIRNPTYLNITKLPKLLTENTYEVFEKSDLVLNNGYTLTLGEQVFHQHALIGRGTCVVKARLKSAPRGASTGAANNQWSKPLIVKFSYGATSRTEKEADIILKLRRLASDEDKEMLKYLPNFLHNEDRELSGVPKSVADYMNKHFKDSYEHRTLHVTVQEELFRVQDLVAQGKVEEFGKAVYDIFTCKRYFLDSGSI